MNLTIPKETFAAGLARISRVVPARTTLPVLGNVLIATDGPRLKLAATDLTTSITTWLEADVAEAGSLTVPARTLAELVATLARGDSVHLKADHETLTVRAGGTKTELTGLAADEFPFIPLGDSFESLPAEFETALLKDAIQRTTCCAARSDTRPILMGVLLQARGGRATLVGTDGFRLAVVHLPVSGPDLSLIIPAVSLNHLERQLDTQAQVSVRVAPGGSCAVFTAGETEVVSQLLEGTYPNYEAVIPSTSRVVVEVEAAALLEAVQAVRVFARDNKDLTRFTVERESLTLLGQSPEAGSGTARIPVRLPVPAACDLPLEITFDAGFVMDALKGCSGQCLIHLNTRTTAARFTPGGSDVFQTVIMPVLGTG